MVMLDVLAHREQAHSYSGCALDADFVITAEQMWERACSRWRCVSRQ
jgi:hypothetical protein